MLHWIDALWAAVLSSFLSCLMLAKGCICRYFRMSFYNSFLPSDNSLIIGMLFKLLWTDVRYFSFIKSVLVPFDLLETAHIQYDNTGISTCDNGDFYEELRAFWVRVSESFISLGDYWWFLSLTFLKWCGFFSSCLRVDQTWFVNLISHMLSDNGFHSRFMNHRLCISHVSLCVPQSP